MADQGDAPTSGVHPAVAIPGQLGELGVGVIVWGPRVSIVIYRQKVGWYNITCIRCDSRLRPLDAHLHRVAAIGVARVIQCGARWQVSLPATLALTRALVLAVLAYVLSAPKLTVVEENRDTIVIMIESGGLDLGVLYLKANV